MGLARIKRVGAVHGDVEEAHALDINFEDGDVGAETGGHHSALCATHAGRLRPPLGWSYQDRRTARPAALAPPNPQPPNLQAPPAIAV